jgi:hypothetical protein
MLFAAKARHWRARMLAGTSVCLCVHVRDVYHDTPVPAEECMQTGPE